jgi:hypothetical protein
MNVGSQDNITSIASIASVRTSLWDEFLTTEAGGSVSTITRLCMNPDPINEHSDILPEDPRKVA